MTNSASVHALVDALHLPAGFAAIDTYERIAAHLDSERRHRGRPLTVGISGAQGSGKTTIARFLEQMLAEKGQRTALLSLDDFYHTKADRADLAATTHPLLATRGVPGTHDIGLLGATMERIRSAAPDEATLIPVFDKARDDRLPKRRRRSFAGRADIILLEGWCLGARAVPPASLAQPINRLEAEEDRDGRWRRFVNDQLGGAYARLFGRIDLLLFIAAPSFDTIFAWRKLQEDKLRKSGPADAGGLMSDDALARFIMHYERITRQMLSETPAHADILLRLRPDHAIESLEFRGA